MKFLSKILIVSIIFLTFFSFLAFFNFKNNFSSNNEIVIANKESTHDIKTIDISKTNSSLDDEEKNVINIYDSLSPAVVNITVYKTEYINYFFDMYPQQSEGQGSGAIIDKSGYIITNYHVVGDSDKVTVALSQNEKVYEADIIGIDPENDLAVIKIKNPPKNLITIPAGNSSNLKVGQKVYAIGNPFGLDRTLTSGIISGLGRPIKTESGSVIEGAIQTDASINPGNSGGPLIDSSGKIIGINTMIISPSGGSIGLGFSIPINTALETIPELIKFGHVKRGWIDATFLQITPGIARALNSSVDSGLLIMQIARNGEAYKAGLRGGNEKAVYGNKIVYIGGDIIVSVNGIKISDYSALVQVLKNKKPGVTVNVEYYRDNKKYSSNVKLVDKKNFEN